jgi:hypothetical protein
VKAALLLLALTACEHAETADKKQPPAPPKPDPVQQARAEFELLPADSAAGTSKLYSRGVFMPDAGLADEMDEGDFIGRLRTLFGPRDGDDYVLRHKKTGLIITAYCGDSGPSYGGTPDEVGRDARMKADPMLKGELPPMTDVKQYRIYERHLDDAIAGPERGAVIARLDALVSLVPPADWSTVKYYEDGPTVYRVGAKGGHSFEEDLPPAESLDFLLHAAETDDRDGLADEAVLAYYAEHKDELSGEKPRVVASYRRFLAAANKADSQMRSVMLDEARNLKP